VLNALRARRNRPYLHVLVFVLLVSLVSTLVFSTCTMPKSWRITSSETQSEKLPTTVHPAHVHEHEGHLTKAPDKDCSLKPCTDPQPNSVVGYKFEKPELTLILLCLFWALGCLLLPVLAQRIPRDTSPPQGRRIPLIYQFCTLLN
jgi:hypothetical protein